MQKIDKDQYEKTPILSGLKLFKPLVTYLYFCMLMLKCKVKVDRDKKLLKRVNLGEKIYSGLK